MTVMWVLDVDGVSDCQQQTRTVTLGLAIDDDERASERASAVKRVETCH